MALLHWLAVLQWVRLPHWSAYLGWLALSVYLAIYPLLFLAISRTAYHRLKWPLIVVCPVVWCGLEFLRGHMFTGFAMAVLGHTQAYRPRIAQFADLGGTIGLGLVMVVVATALVEAVYRQRRWYWVALAAGVCAGVVGYGQWRLDQIAGSAIPDRSARVALVQGSIDTTFNQNDDPNQAFDQYMNLSREVVQHYPDLDLIVWPESMFTSTYPLVKVQSPAHVPEAPEDIEPGELERRLRGWEHAFEDKVRWVDQQLRTPLLVGCETHIYGPFPPRRYNSALWIDETGKTRGRYDKMHPVMFGEYVPLGHWFPAVYRLFPMDGGLTPGEQPMVVEAGTLRLSPSICFENTVPHLLRRQVRQLQREGTPPDVLVTITNDGWFWGSSLLDAHLACGIFRAIELRKPMLIAANTGFSAVIDPAGRVLQRGPRRATDVLVADVTAYRTDSWYLRSGDWLGWLTVTVCGVWMVAGWRARTE